MANGFPEGEFFLLNTQAMLCLAANPGGTWNAGSFVTKSGSEIEYTHTKPPVAQVECPNPPGRNQFQGWYLDTSKDSWGKPANYLVSRMVVSTLGRFALQGSEFGFGVERLEMWGTGHDKVAA